MSRQLGLDAAQFGVISAVRQPERVVVDGVQLLGGALPEGHLGVAGLVLAVFPDVGLAGAAVGIAEAAGGVVGRPDKAGTIADGRCFGREVAYVEVVGGAYGANRVARAVGAAAGEMPLDAEYGGVAVRVDLS